MGINSKFLTFLEALIFYMDFFSALVVSLASELFNICYLKFKSA